MGYLEILNNLKKQCMTTFCGSRPNDLQYECGRQCHSWDKYRYPYRTSVEAKKNNTNNNIQDWFPIYKLFPCVMAEQPQPQEQRAMPTASFPRSSWHIWDALKCSSATV
ncbi:uncharacterized protein LOC119689967 [Teleopsis dalmanni]|uniref:uncharacterized protein LOC119689967 n=1 Tax=Teleopsis dalmanni TaxID=139649 RepID=UPI0018CCA7A9|nr:uncharacterized protein LOC119689967 [Teleopsis dalmanni]XP_037960856.1 uncharacterized protein LOC119689967 [Teleopsis dalmanni]